MRRNIIIEIISALLAFLFVYAAVSKLAGYTTFRIQISQSPFITQFATPISWLVPLFELAISILLAFPKLRLYALYGSLFLLSTFTAWLIAMLNFSHYIPCSCGGILSSLTWKQHIILNAGFIILSITAIFLISFENKHEINFAAQ